MYVYICCLMKYSDAKYNHSSRIFFIDMFNNNVRVKGVSDLFDFQRSIFEKITNAFCRSIVCFDLPQASYIVIIILTS